MKLEFKGEICYTQNGMRITPYREHQCYQLENMTSIREKGFGGHLRKPITGFLIPFDEKKDSKYGTFISHKHNPMFIQSLFPNYQVKYEESNKEKQIIHDFGVNPDISPREAQLQIMNKICKYENSNQWFVYLSQGLGKTLLSVYMITYFHVKSLIMCYNTRVLQQWVNTFKEKTSMDMRAILFINEGKILDKILDGSFPVWEYDIFMCTPKLLTMYGKRYGYKSLSLLMDKMGIGLKIFDEAHRNITNIIKINAYTSVKRTLYLSGDFAQSNTRKEDLYYKIFLGVPVLKPSNVLMNTLKYTIAVVVSYETHPSEEELKSVYPRRGFSFYNYMKYQINQKMFYDTLWFILDSINKANTNNFRILILVNMIEHVNILKDEIEEHYPNRYIVGRYHSGVSEEEKKEAKNNAEIIVSTHSSFGVGIDTTRIKYVISGCVGTKIDDNQASGRARPLEDHSDVFYFMMLDMGFSYCKKTLRDRLDYLEKTKIKAIKHIKL